jgi:hypothetical protein
MMADIYSESIKLLIWLGDRNFDLGGESFDQAALEYCKSVGESTYASEGSDSDLDALRPLLRSVASSIFESPWFHRRWVVQEFVMQSTRTVAFGNYQLHASTMTKLARLRGLTENEKYAKSFWLDNMTSTALNASYGYEILGNLLRFDHMQCRDLRDSIFALASFSLDGHRLSIDYEQSAHSLWTSLARDYISRGHLGLILACASRDG